MNGAGSAAPPSRDVSDAVPGRFLVGLIGAGIGRSLSPALHEEEARYHRATLHYHLIELDAPGRSAADLPALLDAVRRLGFAGVNITHPCKQAVMPLLDALSDDARRIGAVNTVVLEAGRLIGHNTDWSGFSLALRDALPDAARGAAALLGAGGAGAAVGYAALHLGVRELSIVDPAAGRAQALADNLMGHFPQARVRVCADAAVALRGAHGLIHATPTGMHGHAGLPLDPELLRPDLWVSEVVYFPLQTALLAAARARGCRVLDGGGMAVGQAFAALRLFTGLTPDFARMQAHFRRLAG